MRYRLTHLGLWIFWGVLAYTLTMLTIKYGLPTMVVMFAAGVPMASHLKEFMHVVKGEPK